ncbi:hypothetical protein R1sor_026180 [Riccia sorocarpa]|uniref:F-box domain-containing protein n=1 Tax=Riccia sorocarpa TaxID=122646 RepID=A0ABD3GAP3_9MARC
MIRQPKACRLVGKQPNLGGKMSVGEDGRGEDAMDPRLWGQLPHEILFAVLAWLPLRTLARLKVVSKSWLTMWSCPIFMQFRARIAQPPDSYDYQVLATARGLLLCGKRPPRIYSFTNFWPEKDNKSLQMIVCNPLRENCEVVLPERIGTWRPCVVGMIGGEGNTYKVILASFMYGTEIYDSCSRRWKLISTSDVRNGPLSPGFNPSIICHNGCMLYVGRSLSGDAAAVFLFNGDTEQWSSFDLPVSGVGLQYLQLQDCGGRLFLVGHMKTMTEYRHFLCFGDVFVWERIGEDIVEGFWERRFSPDPQYPSHFPVLSSPKSTASLARSKPEDLFCYSKATFGTAEHDNSIEHLSLYSVTSNCWWSCAEGRICTHDSFQNRKRSPGSAGVTYRCDFVFEPRIESLP